MVDHDLDGRSQSHAWRELHAEGILWDGPVFVVDGANQLPLRLMATSQRLAFTKGGAFMLEIPREWLHPAPYMNPDGSVSLTVDAGEGNRPETLRLIARDGRRLAVDLVAALHRSRSYRPERSHSIYAPEPDGELPEPSVARGRRAARPPIEPDGEPGSDAALIGHLDSDDFPPFTAAPTRSKPSAAEQDHRPAAAFVAESPAPAREGDWSLRPIDAMSTRSDRLARRGWAIRLSGLVVLLLLAAAFGSGRMPTLPGRDFASRIPDTGLHAPFSDDEAAPTQPAVAQADTPAPTATGAAPQPTTATKTVAEARPTTPPSETAIALGVGGMAENLDAVTAPAVDPTLPPTATSTPTATPTATAEPTKTPEPSPTATIDAPVAPAEVAEPEPTATLPPAPEPTATPTEEPTLAPTQTPEPEPTEAPTQAPTATNEPAPATEIVATPEPTLAPTETLEPTATATLEPTATPSPTSTPSPTPTATPTEKPSFPSQGASLREGELPAQAFTSGPVRYTVEFAQRDTQIDAVQLTPIQGAEWVVVVVHAENWSDDDVTLDGATLQLISFGLYGAIGVAPDPVSNVIAEMLGLEPAAGVDVTIPTGDGKRIALAYLVRPDTTEIQLTTGATTIDLSEAMGQAVSLTNLGDEPEAPQMVQATVVEVLDGESIVVETEDGARAKVRYLGVQAPLGTACYAAESTAINASLVDGKTVFLERERKNRAPNSRLARDVWVKGADGKLTLVAASLAAAGSVVPAPVDPDVRFAGWIQAAADGAQYNLAGLWGACGGLQAPPPEQSAAAPQTADPAPAVPVEADVPAPQVIEQVAAG